MTQQKTWRACRQLWIKPQINWDGMLLGCCCNAHKNFGVNVFEVGLEKAVSSDLYDYTKKMLLGQVPGKEESPCFCCQFYKQMVEKNYYVAQDEITGNVVLNCKIG